MAKSLCPDKLRVAIALLTAISLLLLSGVVVQVLLMLTAALIGWRFISAQPVPAEQASAAAAKPTGVVPVLMFAVFAGLLVLLPALAADTDSSMLKLFDHFYRAGALLHITISQVSAHHSHTLLTNTGNFAWTNFATDGRNCRQW